MRISRCASASSSFVRPVRSAPNSTAARPRSLISKMRAAASCRSRARKFWSRGREVVAAIGPCDLILVEGYKGAPIPKIEARRGATLKGRPLAASDANVIAVAADHAADGAGRPVFALDDIVGLADFLAASSSLICAIPSSMFGTGVAPLRTDSTKWRTSPV